jgi:hypothetical protein
MADSKISALTGATTPLAGTEVLPIVQGGATVKVAISNLTAGRAVAASSFTAPTIGAGSGSALSLQANGTTKATLDVDGSFGIAGAVPSASGANNRALEFPLGTTLTAYVTDPYPSVGLSSNAVIVSGGWTYKTGTGGSPIAATLYSQEGYNGFHTWSVAPAGVAGDAISFVQRMKLDASGVLTLSNYGAGAATFSAAGVISSVSDETWKIKDGLPTDTDLMLKKLQPGYWYYNEEKAPIYGADRQLGFFAQNVNFAIGPEAAPTPEEGKPWGYYDRSVLAVVVMSLQKALETIESLTSRIDALEAK